MRRENKTTCSAAKVALVATSRVGVGPGVKTLDQSSSTNDPMMTGEVFRSDAKRGLESEKERARVGARNDVEGSETGIRS